MDIAPAEDGMVYGLKTIADNCRDIAQGAASLLKDIAAIPAVYLAMRQEERFDLILESYAMARNSFAEGDMRKARRYIDTMKIMAQGSRFDASGFDALLRNMVRRKQDLADYSSEYQNAINSARSGYPESAELHVIKAEGIAARIGIEAHGLATLVEGIVRESQSSE